MPELTAIHLGLLALMLIAGLGFGWILRASRATREKIAVSAGWQQQLESQYAEQGRLAEQNKGLMEQISQNQATQKEAAGRAGELSKSLNDAYEIRDELQQKLEEQHSKLQIATAERNKFQGDIAELEARLDDTKSRFQQKDERIQELKRDLAGWHSRLPPLIERYKVRDQEAQALEGALEEANTRLEDLTSRLDEAASRLEEAASRIEELEELEQLAVAGQTRIEPVDSRALPDGLDASNEPHDIAPESPSRVPGDLAAAATARDGVDADEEPPAAEDGGGAAPAEADDSAASGEHGDEAPAPGLPDDQSAAGGDTADGAPVEDVRNDDLKQIKGIGPAIEKTLNELGIYRFRQISEMSEYEIDRVAQRLKGFRSRIYREDWLGQARDLHYQKYKSLT